MGPYDLKCEIPSEPSVARFRISYDRQIRRRQSLPVSSRRLQVPAARDGSHVPVAGKLHGQLLSRKMTRFNRHRRSRRRLECSSHWDIRTASTARSSLYRLPCLTLRIQRPSGGIFSSYTPRCPKTPTDLGRYITPYIPLYIGAYRTTCSSR